ncbi:DNA (cytosine-5-)-methyltransferase [Micromonospora sp. NPDC002296]|uniref:DNA cytosine methyltransferase n=1 Tax=Micromonospora sp. NPDC002296 TaxID=3154271 RepID=UPI00332CA478
MSRTSRTPRVAGLFAGIGGIEVGLKQAGHETALLCEIDAAAAHVLQARFPGIPLRDDVRTLGNLPTVDLVAAGFPCTDLSQAGRKIGITGRHSSLVDHVFRLIDSPNGTPTVLLENVSYMLRLDKGEAMGHLVRRFEELGYAWAYRVVDARSFGVPQRRQRVVMIASRSLDPREVLFADEGNGSGFQDLIGPVDEDCAYGFYWTEGLRGLGWARNAVPTIKGGSGLGIPSAPAVWVPATGEVGTPEIEDGERMQGFPADWTLPAIEAGHKPGFRWRMVGNAVCVPMAAWVGRRISEPGTPVVAFQRMSTGGRWPLAAWGARGERWSAEASMQPFDEEPNLLKFLAQPLRPLSSRAVTGFLSRARSSRLRFSDGFLDALEAHRLRVS